MLDADGSPGEEPLFTAKPSLAMRAVSTIVFSGSGLLSLSLAAYCAVALDGGLGTKLCVVTLFVLGAAGCVFMVTDAFRTTMFYRDRVVQTGLLGSRTLTRDNIKGYYTDREDNPQIELAPRDDAVRSIFVDRCLLGGDEAKRWLAGLVYLRDAE